MENTNTLKLRKCAYIFDSSASRYFYGTKAQHAEKAATEKEMKKYFEDPEKLNEKIPYTKDSKGKDILTMLIYEIDKTDIKKYGTNSHSHAHMRRRNADCGVRGGAGPIATADAFGGDG